MAVLSQYDYIFAIGLIVAFLDAWNIGANDVASSFATPPSSRFLTMKQAMCIASAMEFAGSMAVGARVADTIRTKVIDVTQFELEPSVLMLAMTCAVIGSSIYLTFATKIGLPVSTTHSIIGGVIGVGIASLGADGVRWSWNGVSQVFAAWAIARGISAVFGAILFLITKFGVMLRNDPVKAAFISISVYFFLSTGLLAMLIVWKGAESSIDLSDGWIAGTIILVASICAGLSGLSLLPYMYRKLLKGDWQLKWWQFIYGPILLHRDDPPPCPDNVPDLVDYYAGHLTAEQLDVKRNGEIGNQADPEKTGTPARLAHPLTRSAAPLKTIDGIPPRPEGGWKRPAVLWWKARRIFFRGVEKDVVSSQGDKAVLSGDLEKMHARAQHYDNRAEYCYSFLQVLTATTASLSHSANDISNAIGPFATIYLIWSSGELQNRTPVSTWILAFGGVALVIGLWTYGYNIMRNLGTRITLHSTSRGFSIQLGSAIIVIMATRLKLPISTTQCITGATVGVGLCNRDWRIIN